ncbi:contact-dependent growth inhibition system immunity protein [Psychrobacter sp. TWP2-1-2]|uniref:contact-dependent growth inhibition system immunity protein n=1 Tax=Psychrobacter sp. TWP2-1-2 TaxID=2804623 RepID=UPI003CF6A95E
MHDTFIYFMNAYFYQDWQSEYSGTRVDDTNVLIRFVQNENLEIVTNLVTDIKYILSNDLAKQIFDTNNFDFNPLLYGYSSEREWFEVTYKKLISEIK